MDHLELLVLVVEDDPAVLRFIRRTLELNEYRVIGATDGLSALDVFRTEAPDLVLLDIGIPELDGLDICRLMRANSEVPIIMVTARSSDEDVVRGLEAGADDYLGKPFSTGVLVARVRAVLRRSRPLAEAGAGRITCGQLVIDLGARRVIRSGEAVHLTPTEYRLMVLFARQVGRVLSSRQILTEVWSAEYASETQILRTHIGRLRRKIEPDPDHPTVILTEPAVGYSLICSSE